ncbi:hypothetical protein ZHAS_00000180 [Anopheles sinensis]|uniref:Uncharacterized protein n=1 Tax=Anopheles sinensis TaxID=74873 RepID=A0A084V9Z2_ANOSI|nr:hypothetical protein ZHAS_00000180 [Anopheles sinensis]
MSGTRARNATRTVAATKGSATVNLVEDVLLVHRKRAPTPPQRATDHRARHVIRHERARLLLRVLATSHIHSPSD